MNIFYNESKKKIFFFFGGGGGGGGSVIVFFFYKESKSKKNFFFFGGGGGVEGGLARVNEFFSTKNPNLKKKNWRGRWMDRRTGPNQFAPS